MKKRRVQKRRARCTRLRKQVTRLQHDSTQYEVLAGIYERALDDTEVELRRVNWKLRDSQKLAKSLAAHNTELSAKLRLAKKLGQIHTILTAVTFGAIALIAVLELLY